MCFASEHGAAFRVTGYGADRARRGEAGFGFAVRSRMLRRDLAAEALPSPADPTVIVTMPRFVWVGSRGQRTRRRAWHWAGRLSAPRKGCHTPLCAARKIRYMGPRAGVVQW